VSIKVYIAYFPIITTYFRPKLTKIVIIEPLQSAIEVQQVRFSSNLKFDKDGELYRIVNPDEPPYAGAPSNEIDRAWEEITNCKRFSHIFSSKVWSD
jgi:hypothetical protein